ncbi:NAD(P)-dependent dehydrogenase (short-subunit alcohol dehydrogenase family) [Novosphingobium chloroacetimidivorans]|uniref:NAD(P)-dependent dehydrogenase (Short-subunit alcohol dehydrogenase family) n=1 Tax=Novosphingobium chloroacetimidivorans TaxID=1428314 RepID=A0A7W7K9T8_9SPHN|nr:SDR family oxidoreductase [Novosphingobium chloroacetimidivorans]MBB4858354.1 NAD(P)-dependent dehydrogenase (short-subunit alcohol dehydrogenase family) [Novosphingobium chloroacetimidivorans]
MITGTGGLGYETAVALAAAGGRVILAGRNAEKGAQAVTSITARTPGADVTFEALDLANLQSVRDFAERLLGRAQPIHRLICNAGIMSPPKLERTADGHEVQFGVNYLSHFALTARLMPLLRAAPAARVVSVTSLAQNYAKLDLGNLDSEKAYHPGKAYCTSKLLQAMFAVELQRRSDQADWGITSVAAHPGFAGTNLFETGGAVSRLISTRIILPMIGQSAAGGAQSILLAATAADVRGGLLYGPTGFMHMRGAPGLGKYPALVHDEGLRAQVWKLSESLTGVSYE